MFFTVLLCVLCACIADGVYIHYCYTVTSYVTPGGVTHAQPVYGTTYEIDTRVHMSAKTSPADRLCTSICPPTKGTFVYVGDSMDCFIRVADELCTPVGCAHVCRYMRTPQTSRCEAYRPDDYEYMVFTHPFNYAYMAQYAGRSCTSPSSISECNSYGMCTASETCISAYSPQYPIITPTSSEFNMYKSCMYVPYKTICTFPGSTTYDLLRTSTNKYVAVTFHQFNTPSLSDHCMAQTNMTYVRKLFECLIGNMTSTSNAYINSLFSNIYILSTILSSEGQDFGSTLQWLNEKGYIYLVKCASALLGVTVLPSTDQSCFEDFGPEYEYDYFTAYPSSLSFVLARANVYNRGFTNAPQYSKSKTVDCYLDGTAVARSAMAFCDRGVVKSTDPSFKYVRPWRRIYCCITLNSSISEHIDQIQNGQYTVVQIVVGPYTPPSLVTNKLAALKQYMAGAFNRYIALEVRIDFSNATIAFYNGDVNTNSWYYPHPSAGHDSVAAIFNNTDAATVKVLIYAMIQYYDPEKITVVAAVDTLSKVAKYGVSLGMWIPSGDCAPSLVTLYRLVHGVSQDADTSPVYLRTPGPMYYYATNGPRAFCDGIVSATGRVTKVNKKYDTTLKVPGQFYAIAKQGFQCEEGEPAVGATCTAAIPSVSQVTSLAYGGVPLSISLSASDTYYNPTANCFYVGSASTTPSAWEPPTVETVPAILPKRITITSFALIYVVFTQKVREPRPLYPTVQ